MKRLTLILFLLSAVFFSAEAVPFHVTPSTFLPPNTNNLAGWNAHTNDPAPGSVVIFDGTFTTAADMTSAGSFGNPLTIYVTNALWSAPTWDSGNAVHWHNSPPIYAVLWADTLDNVQIIGDTNKVLVTSSDNGIGLTHTNLVCGFYVNHLGGSNVISGLVITNLLYRTNGDFPFSSEGLYLNILGNSNVITKNVLRLLGNAQTVLYTPIHGLDITSNYIDECSFGIFLNAAGGGGVADGFRFTDNYVRNGTAFQPGTNTVIRDQLHTDTLINNNSAGACSNFNFLIARNICDASSTNFSEGSGIFYVNPDNRNAVSNMMIVDNFVLVGPHKHFTGGAVTLASSSGLVANNTIVSLQPSEFGLRFFTVSEPEDGTGTYPGPRVLNNLCISLSSGYSRYYSQWGLTNAAGVHNGLADFNCFSAMPDNGGFDYYWYRNAAGGTVTTSNGAVALNPVQLYYGEFKALTGFEANGSTNTALTDANWVPTTNDVAAYLRGTNLNSLGIAALSNGLDGITRPISSAWTIGAYAGEIGRAHV